ncbi:MAG: cytochrome c peroxidase [Gammaproteobacteria bacterium]|jgi:cytochrome c peroxidase
MNFISVRCKIFGDAILDTTKSTYRAISEAIAAFEQSALFSPYDSKYDRYLRGNYELNDLEDLGMTIFFSTTNSNCSNCHQFKVMDDEFEPFSNFEYNNIGVPTNLLLRRHNGVALGYRDPGLGEVLKPNDSNWLGTFRVPILRNVALTGPYMHNGVFRDLRTVIEFYDQYNNSKRVNNPETEVPWRSAEIVETVNLNDLKAKKLSDRKIEALIAFLKTLTDKRYEHLVN